MSCTQSCTHTPGPSGLGFSPNPKPLYDSYPCKERSVLRHLKGGLGWGGEEERGDEQKHPHRQHASSIAASSQVSLPPCSCPLPAVRSSGGGEERTSVLLDPRNAKIAVLSLSFQPTARSVPYLDQPPYTARFESPNTRSCNPFHQMQLAALHP